jgi:acyl-CoA dehydrogenase
MNNRSEQSALLADTISTQLLDMENSGLLKSESERLERGEWPRQLWEQLEENGLTSILVPESEGGFGGGWEDAGVLLFFAGAHSVPVPIAETVLTRLLLSRAGIDPPPGALAIACADRMKLERRTSGSWRIHGNALGVLWGGMVEHVVVARRDGAAYRLALVHRSAIEPIASRHDIAREPTADLRFHDAEAIAVATVIDDPFELGALTRAALMAGASNSILQQSVQYANDRRQFGKPIGKFQVIQHALATLANEAAAMNCAALAACRAADRGDARFEIAAAKLRANRAVSAITSIAHQVHGAIGFTAECRLHFATQRLWAWRSQYGNDRYWAARLGDAALRHGSNGLWPHLTSLTDVQPQH